MEGLKIFYVYFHDVRFVPIHACEVIAEMKRRGADVQVFTSIRDEEERRKLSATNARIHNLWTVEMRIISELFFILILFPYFFLCVLFRRPDVFYSRDGASSLVACLSARMFGKPCVLEVNDIIQDKLEFNKISWIKKIWIKLYQSVNYHLAELLLPVTPEIGQWIRRTYNLKRTEIIVVPNGVNVERFSPKPVSAARERFNIPEGSRVVLALGSLFPWAGMEVLVHTALKVVQKRSDVLFVIGSGEEPYLSQVRKLIAQAGLEQRFLFFGFIPWDQAAWFISMADVCVAPFILKKKRTGLSSLRVLSYLACAKPVVGSDIPGLGDMLEREHIGISVPMGDADAMAAALLEILGDEQKRTAMGERARKYVIEHQSWEAIVGRLRAVFQKMIKNRVK